MDGVDIYTVNKPRNTTSHEAVCAPLLQQAIERLVGVTPGVAAPDKPLQHSGATVH